MTRKWLNTTCVAILLLTQSCAPKTTGTAKATPRCLKETLEGLRREGCSKGASLKEYSFQNKTVYVFEPGNCGADMAAPVLDKRCERIGYLGGFTGNTIINGEDFGHARYIKTIWSN